MPLPLHLAFWIADMVWVAFSGCITSCLALADEVAGSIRTGDIGAFHIG
ncbi:uncharacterized protein LOC120090170 [Benincasa hispida]|nr:uncharacterized protein LOC120090170 [Benincasa hispida]XP_038903623.1 uncharacterized protein LOC120090170 [Benincasa hispida]